MKLERYPYKKKEPVCKYSDQFNVEKPRRVVGEVLWEFRLASTRLFVRDYDKIVKDLL